MLTAWLRWPGQILSVTPSRQPCLQRDTLPCTRAPGGPPPAGPRWELTEPTGQAPDRCSLPGHSHTGSGWLSPPWGGQGPAGVSHPRLPREAWPWNLRSCGPLSIPAWTGVGRVRGSPSQRGLGVHGIPAPHIPDGGSFHLGSLYLGFHRSCQPLAPVHAAPRGCQQRRKWGAARRPAWPVYGKSVEDGKEAQALLSALSSAQDACPPPSGPGPLLQEALLDSSKSGAGAPCGLLQCPQLPKPCPLWVV